MMSYSLLLLWYCYTTVHICPIKPVFIWYFHHFLFIFNNLHLNLSMLSLHHKVYQKSLLFLYSLLSLLISAFPIPYHLFPLFLGLQKVFYSVKMHSLLFLFYIVSIIYFTLALTILVLSIFPSYMLIYRAKSFYYILLYHLLKDFLVMVLVSLLLP